MACKWMVHWFWLKDAWDSAWWSISCWWNVILTTEWLPWLWEVSLEWKLNRTKQPQKQMSSSPYNHNTLATLRTSMKESLQMHFNIAVRNFYGPDASRWFLHRCSEGYQCVVVVRWTWKLPLRLPFVISIYVPLTITISLAGATRLTTLWLKHPIGLCSVAMSSLYTPVSTRKVFV